MISTEEYKKILCLYIMNLVKIFPDHWAIIHGYKIGVTKWFRNNTVIQIVCQKSFFDHIIRFDESLNTIRTYIINNPAIIIL